MFADNTLTPKEAVRLCALGTVASAPMHYGELAGSVRHFTARVMGPSLDLMGVSIELLRYEGLVIAIDGSDDDALLQITPAGQTELTALLTARLRPSSDLSKLLIALKMRFLHLLPQGEQKAQIDLLAETFETELNRLLDLRDHHAADEGHLAGWLDHDIQMLEQRIQWLDAFASSL